MVGNVDGCTGRVLLGRSVGASQQGAKVGFGAEMGHAVGACLQQWLWGDEGSHAGEGLHKVHIVDCLPLHCFETISIDP